MNCLAKLISFGRRCMTNPIANIGTAGISTIAFGHHTTAANSTGVIALTLITISGSTFIRRASHQARAILTAALTKIATVTCGMKKSGMR